MHNQKGKEMNEEQQAALVISQAAAGMIEAMGYQAENKQREATDQPPAYTEINFQQIISDRGLHYNTVIETLR